MNWIKTYWIMAGLGAVGFIAFMFLNFAQPTGPLFLPVGVATMIVLFSVAVAWPYIRDYYW